MNGSQSNKDPYRLKNTTWPRIAKIKRRNDFIIVSTRLIENAIPFWNILENKWNEENVLKTLNENYKNEAFLNKKKPF